MVTNLLKYFPMLRGREVVLEDIKSNRNLLDTFNSWTNDERERFISYCTGQRGLKISYDPYFKEVFDVNIDKDRLDRLLSAIMDQKVEVLYAIPNDSARIASEQALLITDIVVRLENQSLVNLEIQKIGYYFSGQRAACYSADLLLREYKRIKDDMKKKFTYKSIMPIYTIVIFEDSPYEVKMAKDYYIHKSNLSFDTGIKVDLLQNFIFISLDNFHNIIQNRVEKIRKGDGIDNLSEMGGRLIKNELEKWLLFLSFDEPEYIEALINADSYYERLYKDIYNMCLNTERLMNMFSAELFEADKNTIKYMMDDMQEQIDDLHKQVAEKDAVLTEKDAVLTEKDAAIDDLKKKVEALEARLV